jgi:hypothetical protein
MSVVDEFRWLDKRIAKNPKNPDARVSGIDNYGGGVRHKVEIPGVSSSNSSTVHLPHSG